MDKFSDSKTLTTAGVDLACYIANKFPYRAINIAGPKYPEFVNVRRMIDKCCCDSCRLEPICAQTGHECRAFREYMKLGKWSESDIAIRLR